MSLVDSPIALERLGRIRDREVRADQVQRERDDEEALARTVVPLREQLLPVVVPAECQSLGHEQYPCSVSWLICELSS